MLRIFHWLLSSTRWLLAEFFVQILAALALLAALGVWVQTGSLIAGLAVLGVALLLGAPAYGWIEGARKRRDGRGG